MKRSHGEQQGGVSYASQSHRPLPVCCHTPCDLTKAALGMAAKVERLLKGIVCQDGAWMKLIVRH